MINQVVVTVMLFLMVVFLPFVFKKKEQVVQRELPQEETLVIITPHNEAVRYEFTQGFRKWYKKKTGKIVTIDWRVLGATQEVIRYVNSLYAHAFEYYWEKNLEYEWTHKVADVFADERIKLPKDPKDDTREEAIRRSFLEADISCGIDLLFGGGELEIKDQARRGQLANSGILELHPDWFREDVIPQKLGGVDFYDVHGLWVSATHSGFGIIYNRDVLKNLSYQKEPAQWGDLSEDVFFGEVALADPTVSSSSNRAFEMIMQEEMTKEYNRVRDEKVAVQRGWDRGLQLIQLIAANARYFTDSSTKPVLDVSSGDCAVGMSIDFYGLYQEENLKNRSDSERFGFKSPLGGSSPTADTIAMFKGAPNPELALAFIEYTLSEEGQKLWAFKVGTPGGPIRYALRRPPVRKDLYLNKYYDYRSNPELNAYRDIGSFQYRSQWTAPMFKVLRFGIKSAFVDPHKELVQAWKAIIQARKEGRRGDADRALAVLQNLEELFYDEGASNEIRQLLNGSDPLKVIQLQGNLTEKFIRKYELVKMIARGDG